MYQTVLFDENKYKMPLFRIIKLIYILKITLLPYLVTLQTQLSRLMTVVATIHTENIRNSEMLKFCTAGLRWD